MNGYPVIARMYLKGKLFQEVNSTTIVPRLCQTRCSSSRRFKEQKTGEM